MANPAIRTAAETVGPALARHGLDLLASLFGDATKSDREALAELIAQEIGIDVEAIADDQLDEAAWGRLREFELAEQKRLLALARPEPQDASQRQPLANGDRRDVRRSREKASESDDRFIRYFRHLYVLLITVLTFSFIFFAAFVADYADNDPALRIVDTVLGFLLGVSLAAIIQFFFGSNQGSASEQEQISALLRETGSRTAPGGRDHVAG